jgi:hypothetical protein
MSEQERLAEEEKQQRKNFAQRALRSPEAKINPSKIYDKSPEMIAKSEIWRLPRFVRDPKKDGVQFENVRAVDCRHFLRDRFQAAHDTPFEKSLGTFEEVSGHYIGVLSKMGKLDKVSEKTLKTLHSQINGRTKNDEQVLAQMLDTIDNLRNEPAKE